MKRSTKQGLPQLRTTTSRKPIRQSTTHTTKSIKVVAKKVQNLDPGAKYEELLDSIQTILFASPSSLSFSNLYPSLRRLKDFQLISKLLAQIEIDLHEYLSIYKYDNPESVIDAWSKYTDKISLLKRVFKYTGLTRTQMPERLKHTRNRIEIYIDDLHIKVWNNSVPSIATEQALDYSISTFIKTPSKLTQTSRSFLNFFAKTKPNVLESISRVIIKPNTSLHDLIAQVNKLKSLFPMEALQKAFFLPYFSQIIPKAVAKRDEALIELSNILAPQFINTFIDLVKSELKTISVPIDFFSIAAFLDYFSSINGLETYANSLVSTAINQESFPSAFIAVIYAHKEYPENLSSLSKLPFFYTNEEALQNELNRMVSINLLKTGGNTQQEKDFLYSIKPLFSRQVFRSAILLLNDFNSTNNLFVVNSKYWTPLVGDDRSRLPSEIEEEAEHQLNAFRTDSHKKFAFSAAYSQMVVDLVYSDTKKSVLMSCLQYQILKRVKERDQSFEHLSVVMKNALRPLEKAKILKKTNFGYSFDKPTTKSQRINVYEAAITARGGKEKKKVKEDHSMQIQSVVARIMKKNRTMKAEELKKKAREEVSNYFDMDGDEYESVLKGMLQMGYIENDKNDFSRLVFVP